VVEERETTWAEVLKVKDREAVWTSSGRVVCGCDGELHYIRCGRGEIPIEGIFSPDLPYEAAGGEALGVRSD
jgi:hypothetical protein